jgi:hypothetical protein
MEIREELILFSFIVLIITILYISIQESKTLYFYDTAQYTKWDYHNRNKIKCSNGEILLTIPVQVSLWQKINEVQFDIRILKKHLKTIEQSYKKAPFFDQYFPKIEELYSYSGKSLSEFNILLITELCKIMWIETKFLKLSDILPNLETQSTQALMDICEFIWADSYISWSWGRNYVEEDLFQQASINISYQDFKHPEYYQLWWGFLPYMSILDLIFNEWEKSRKVLQ